MKVTKVRVGIVGLGLVADSHIKAYQANHDAEVIAVCDLDSARANLIAAKYGIAKTYTSYEKMLLDDDINVVDITTPTVLHASMSIAAARSGKNILCEKPFCLSLEEGQTVINEAAAAGVLLMVGESYIFMTSIMKARELIDQGQIGKPQQIRECFGTWLERPGALETEREISDNHRGWRMDSLKAGGAGFPWMFDHCVHFFATAEYLMQDTKIKEVYALKSNIGWMRDSEEYAPNKSETHVYRPEASEDIPVITWTYEDPACQGVWMRAEALNGKYDPMYGFSVKIIGEKGMIEVLGEGGKGLTWNGKSVHLVLHRKGAESESFCFDEGGDDIWQSEVSYYSRAHLNQINEFIKALILGNRPRYGGIDGYHDVKTTMAAICSAKEGVPVKVTEITDERYNR
jgi:predicted dehydrogenase